MIPEQQNQLTTISERLMPQPGLLSDDEIISSQIDGQRKRITAKDVEYVRQSPFVMPMVQAMAQDACNFDYILTPESTGWQAYIWQDFIDNQFTRCFNEFISWAWFYGTAYAEAEVTTDGLYYYPKNFTPLFMSLVNDKDINKKKEITYSTTKIPSNRLMKLKLFTESGKSIKFGGYLYNFCKMMTTTLDSFIKGTNLHSTGMFIQTYEGDKTPGEGDRNFFKKINSKFQSATSFAVAFPPGWKPNLLTGSVQVDSFKKSMDTLLFIVFSYCRSQYLLSSFTTPGTYGTAELQANFYMRLIESYAWVCVETLNSMARQVAFWNDEACTAFFTLQVDASKRPVNSNALQIVNALKLVMTMFGQLTREQLVAACNMLGFPAPAEDWLPTATTPQPAQAITLPEPDPEPLKNAKQQNVLDWLTAYGNNLKPVLMRVIKKAHDKIPYNKIEMKNEDYEKLKGLIGLQKDDWNTLYAIWDKTEKQINFLIINYKDSKKDWSVIETQAGKDFDIIWLKFEEEVLYGHDWFTTEV